MDKFYVYRPLLDLIGFTEGTDKGDGYNETLAYGKMLDGVLTKGKGKNVQLIDLTLRELDALQTRMLKDPDNKKLNSSACGRYQIVRTTARSIRNVLPDRYPSTRLFDAECQDEMACYLLGVRGVDKYLSGRLGEDTLINNLAKEWASLPTTQGKGHYAGQHTPITTARLYEVLAQVKQRHAEGQPKEQVLVPVDKPTLPPNVEKEVRQKTNWGAWLTTVLSTLTGFGTWLLNADKELVIVVIGGGMAASILILFGGEYIIRRLRRIKKVLEEDDAV